MPHIAVVGAGQAGASLVARLRSKGYEGEITLIGAEPEPPYQRPPLSKAYLDGEMTLERLYLRPQQFYADQGIKLRTRTRVDAIDRSAKELVIGDERLPYDMLALTLGSAPIRLPAAIGGDLAGVLEVRTLADADVMREVFAAARNVLVVGGGYIGLEAAAVAAKRGLNVTLVEREARILGRVASAETADHMRALHQSHGVDLREGVGLERLSGDAQVQKAHLSTGEVLDVDCVVVGIGIRPRIALAEDAGLVTQNGIKVDALCRTSDLDIYAAGDCTSFPYLDGRLRLESVPNAIEQAEAAADAMLGEDAPYEAQPWFWSDQYDAKLQIAGLGNGHDRIVTRGGGDAVSFWYYKGETLLAVDAVNEPRAFMIAKRLLAAGKSPAPEMVSDADLDLKSLLK